ncbi:hypothetical protein MTO96_037131 [Rhipicephalus appendiculatus]
MVGRSKEAPFDASPLDKERHRRPSAHDGWFPIHAARVLHSGAWSWPPPQREPQSHLPDGNRLGPWMPERSCCFAPAPSISSSTAAGAPRRTFGPVGGLLCHNLHFIASPVIINMHRSLRSPRDTRRELEVLAKRSPLQRPKVLQVELFFRNVAVP